MDDGVFSHVDISEVTSCCQKRSESGTEKRRDQQIQRSYPAAQISDFLPQTSVLLCVHLTLRV